MSFTERSVSADGFEIRYLERGDGPPLVCFHGAGGLRLSRAHELLTERHRVIAFELPYSKVRANAADLFWQTSWPWDHRRWIAPDIYTPPTFEAFSRNQDPAMDAILALGEHVPGA